MSGRSFDERIKRTNEKKQSLAQSLIPPKALQESFTGGKDEKESIENPKDSQDSSASPVLESEVENPHSKAIDGSKSVSEGNNRASEDLSTEDEIDALQRKIGGFTHDDKAGGSSVSSFSSTSDMDTILSGFDTPPIPYRAKRYKKERLIDTHEQKSYYIEKEIVGIIDELAGDDTGFKYRFVNEAIRLLIHQEYPELVSRLRPQRK